jgi:Mannosyltransferase (PIG-V)
VRPAFVVWLGSHLAYLCVNVLALAGQDPALPAGSIIDVWDRWDTGHYLRIAEQGYGAAPQDVAFFPLYPTLIHAADLLLPGGALGAALVVSNIAGFFALLVLHRLTRHEVGGEVADRTVFYLVAFPTAFFFAAAYNHSLFLLLTAGSLYAMRRGAWWAAGGLGALAGATRIGGVVLMVPFGYEYLRQRGFDWRRIRPDAAALALVPVGLAGFAAYCAARFDDPFAFLNAQQLWHRQLSWPGDALWRTGVQIGRFPLLGEYSAVNLLDLSAALGFSALLVLCLVGPYRLRRDQLWLTLFGLGVIVLPLLLPATDERPLLSMTRYVLDVIPAFVVLGKMGQSKAFDRIYPMVAVALQGVLLLGFLRNNWSG